MTKPDIHTESGRIVGDNQNSITAGQRGPTLLQDVYLVEKLAHFNRERIPERVVHAKGSGAFGELTVTKDITRYTKAKLFSEVGKKTPMFGRFSTVGGEKGSADSARDPRGFALKFYTEDGNWDLVGNNTPVFFIRDAIKFPDFIHTQKRDPQTNLKDPKMMWDFFSQSPESLHQVMILFSDRGTPFSHRFMHGFSSHAYSMINAAGEIHYVKWHFLTQQGIKNLTAEEAEALAGSNPDHSQQDLFEAIEKGDFPKWTVYIQVMTPEQAKVQRLNPFDVTKVWYHKEFPLMEVGVLELNRNSENYFQDVEQAAFSPGNTVPGLYFSPDKMLQGRLFAYADTQRYRLGINFNQIPVNQPRCQVNSYYRDGFMRVNGNGGKSANYEPNSDPAAPIENPAYKEPIIDIDGPGAHYDRYEDPGNENFEQPGKLYRIMKEDEKDRLVSNLAASIGAPTVPKIIRDRQIELFARCDADLGDRLRKKLP
ncbi:catalase [Zymomonas mobilis]|uniref:Catalase n=1 Tax=Zymomonas mobilis subsp. pomaceae (strain ATCC 29192 / DSM 22645 / JCM 10191 / CCUG 17912 / NBRC 13757 / NCIMB 11200 / NRRL B-4491 / Barker I) TaxID=579138 RepID=F8EUW4_ZYMMT|nr:catalase [Zymomonas mobilis]AEI37252.1 Catalase [Zymomonas mobilis subsp. pomaceae ATCC 29192]MDX5948621.1 catalase [Zymomonas mobilis subsp. pomaceae]GEB88427.1 catalase [Zymomonas mobilis subsp. pomaceae]